MNTFSPLSLNFVLLVCKMKVDLNLGFEPEKDTEAQDEKPSSIILNVKTIRVRTEDCDCQGACSLNH